MFTLAAGGFVSAIPCSFCLSAGLAEAETPEGAAKLELILKHLEEQSGFEFSLEQRAMRYWSVTKRTDSG